MMAVLQPKNRIKEINTMSDINTIYETALTAIDNARTAGEKMDIQSDALYALGDIALTTENREELIRATTSLDMVDTEGCDSDGYAAYSGMDAYEDAGDIAHSKWMVD